MTGAVYFIRIGDDGPVKIGFTSTRKGPAGRIAQLQNASPWKLRILGFVPGSRFVERALLEALQHHRMEGEWLAPNQEVLTLINRVLDHGFECSGVEMSSLDAAIAKAGSNYDLHKATGISYAVISTARKRGMGPKLKARVAAFLEDGGTA